MDAAAAVAWRAPPAARRWWVARALIPALALAALAAALQAGGGDRAVAGALYDAAGGRWLLDTRLPLSQALYHGERALVIGLVLAGLAVLVAGLRHAGARRWRHPVSYLMVCFAATTGLVSLGKHVTNVDCPRALVDYGGERPYVGLFEDRADDLPRAACFPAGHASAGYAFVSLFFLGAGGLRRWAGLAGGLGFGLALGVTQWARGMHFPSHDLVSAAIAWIVAVAAYAVLYRGTFREKVDAPAPG